MYEVKARAFYKSGTRNTLSGYAAMVVTPKDKIMGWAIGGTHNQQQYWPTPEEAMQHYHDCEPTTEKEDPEVWTTLVHKQPGSTAQAVRNTLL
jgi:hypothetical protein